MLIVDDHPDTADVLRRLLKRNGYEAVAAYNGLEALSYLARHRPAAIVLDVMMPGMDGGALLRAIRENAALRDIPVVVFSGDFSFERMRELMSGGAQEYLVKGTVGWDRLLDAVGRYAAAPPHHIAAEAAAESAMLH